MRRFASIGLLCGICFLPVRGSAAEPVLDFLEGLRQRGYYDTALQYIEQIESRPGLSADVKQVLHYERGQTLLQSAVTLSNLDAQRRQLDAAQSALEQFVKEQPGHPLAGRANSSRGAILMERARVDIWDGEKPSNAGSQERFNSAARAAIQQARRIFEQARDQHKKAWEAFPTFIPEEDKLQRAKRDEAETQYIESQLDLAQASYWEAETYPPKSANRKKLLNQAAAQFEDVHERYRTMIGGLYARLWQGKCYEEQGEIGIALGIYNEILKHDGTSDEMLPLKDRALRFRLICLNDESKKDYLLVTQEAEEWLKLARSRARTDVGLGIQWESCRAYEALGIDRTLTENTRQNYLNQALNRARNINRFPGELKNPSAGMIQRVMAALNREPGDPKDFESAYGNAGQLYDRVTELNSALSNLLAAGKQKEARQQREAVRATSGEMARLYELALRLATPATDETMQNIAQMRLAYGRLLEGRYYDAAVLGEYQMAHSTNPETAREAGFLAMAAFDQAYAEAEPSDRAFEGRMVRKMAEQLVKRWPDSDRANDSRNAVAKILFNEGDLLAAADWWLQIPKGSSEYAGAQVRAGNSYWRQYVLEASKPEADRAPAEELAKWKQAAVRHLEAGLATSEKKIPASSRLPDELVRAKLTLANIRNLDGIYKTEGKGPIGALNLLADSPHSVLQAIEVPEGQARPKDSANPRSRQIASFAYQQLLRAQIGLKDIDAAREAREKLEKVAGGEDEAALTQVFVEFGRELQRELERLKATGENRRLEDVRSGFESFLNDIFQRQEGQSFYSLLWIAETYTSLGDGSQDALGKSQEYFQKAAAAYQSILDRAGRDPKFATPEQVLACKLRLVNCLRRQQDYPRAEQLVLELLKQSPNAPDAQFEAARLYQDWGKNGGSNAWEKYAIALYGKKEPVHVWGWNFTAQSLQRAAASKKDDRLQQLTYDARYYQAEAERDFGRAHPDQQKAAEHRDRARAAITGFQRVSRRWPDEEYARFNALYKSVLADLGSTVTDLPRELADSGGAELPVEPAAQASPAAASSPETVSTTAAAPTGARGNLLLMLLIAVGGAGAVAGLFYLSTGRSKKKYGKVASRSATSSSSRPGRRLPETIAIAEPPPRRPIAGSTSRQAAARPARPRPASGSGSSEGVRQRPPNPPPTK